jgi:hypothetical protein
MHHKLELGGQPVAELLENALPELVDRILASLPTELPVYGQLPQEELQGEIAATIQQTLRGFIGAVRTGALPNPEQLSVLAETAARRAEERVPLEAIVAAYHLGVAVCFDYVRELAGPDDAAAALELAALTTRYLQRVVASCCGGYLQERQIQVGDEETSRQALLAALLAGPDVGPDADAAADHAGMTLPSAYLAVSIAVGPHPDETAPGVDPAIAARRKLRRMRAELERRFGGAVLAELSPTRGLLLVPSRDASSTISARDWAAATDLHRALGAAAGADVLAGVAAAPVAETAAAAELAAQVRDVATIAGRGPGVYRLDDVLLEYQLTRPGPARDRLASAVAPLATRPELRETLEAYLEHGLDRQRTARSLHLHPNTVDYRIRKIGVLTGLDATRAGDVVRVRAALAAWRATRATRATASGGRPPSG